MLGGPIPPRGPHCPMPAPLQVPRGPPALFLTTLQCPQTSCSGALSCLSGPQQHPVPLSAPLALSSWVSSGPSHTCWPSASARTVVTELRGPRGLGSGLRSCAPGGALHSSHGALLEAGHGQGDGHWACGLCRVLNWGLFWGLQSRQGRGGEAAGLLWAPRLQSQSRRLGTGTHSCPPTTTSIPTVDLFN